MSYATDIAACTAKLNELIDEQAKGSEHAFKDSLIKYFQSLKTVLDAIDTRLTNGSL